MTHVTLDDLDLWLAGALAPGRAMHFADCPACARLARETMAIAGALANLPRFAPQGAFEERVMRRVRLPDPAWYQTLADAAHRLTAGPRKWALAGSAGALSFASVAALVAVGLTHVGTVGLAARGAGALVTDLGGRLGQAAVTDAAGWAAANPQPLVGAALGLLTSSIVAFVAFRYLFGTGRQHEAARARIG